MINFFWPESVITHTEQILPRKMTDSGVHIHEEYNVCEYMHYGFCLQCNDNNINWLSLAII